MCKTAATGHHARKMASKALKTCLHESRDHWAWAFAPCFMAKPTDREPPRDFDQRLALGRIPSEIHNPSVEVGGELTEQPEATMVGVPARERAEEVGQHALQDPP